MNITRSVVLLLLAMPSVVFAQTVKLVEGDLKALKGEKTIKIDFSYENMTVGDKELKESEYIKDKKAEYDQKEPGRGEKWEQAWIGDREKRFEPKFILLFEKHSKMKAAPDSKYTLIFHTTRTEPGWLVTGMIRKNARIDAQVYIVETANPKNIIARLTVTNAPGSGAMGYDYDTGLRIQEAYAKSGKEVGKVVAR